MENTSENLVCGLCGTPLKTMKTEFMYLEFSFSADIPTCESCGQVYVPPSLARGRIRDVEVQLEDK